MRLTESTGEKAGERPDAVLPTDSEVRFRSNQDSEMAVEPPVETAAADGSSLPVSLQASASSSPSSSSRDSFKTASSSLPMDYPKPRPRIPRSRSKANSMGLVNEMNQ